MIIYQLWLAVKLFFNNEIKNGETVTQSENPQDSVQTEEKPQLPENLDQKLQIKEQPSDDKEIKLQEDQANATHTNTVAPMEGGNIS